MPTLKSQRSPEIPRDLLKYEAGLAYAFVDGQRDTRAMQNALQKTLWRYYGAAYPIRLWYCWQ